MATPLAHVRLSRSARISRTRTWPFVSSWLRVQEFAWPSTAARSEIKGGTVLTRYAGPTPDA